MKRKYDIPLHKKAGTGFVLWTIVLMTFLCATTLCGSFFLTNITNNMEANLTGQLTIEIKAQLTPSDTGLEIDKKAQDELADKVLALIQNNYPGVVAKRLDNDYVIGLIEPWLGVIENIPEMENAFPIPTLIAVEVIDTSKARLETLQQDLKAISSDVYLDKHERWLDGILMITNRVKNIGFFFAVLIGATALIAISGASRARLTMHFAEIELLHLMGAFDSYISRQFAKHSSKMAFEGAFVGTALCLGTAFVLMFAEKPNQDDILDFDLHLEIYQWIAIGFIPVFAGIISYISADITTKNFLKRLP